MISKNFETNQFRAEMNCGFAFVRELDENGFGGKVITFNYSEKKEKKLDEAFKIAISKRMNFSQIWDSIIGIAKDISFNNY